MFYSTCQGYCLFVCLFYLWLLSNPGEHRLISVQGRLLWKTSLINLIWMGFFDWEESGAPEERPKNGIQVSKVERVRIHSERQMGEKTKHNSDENIFRKWLKSASLKTKTALILIQASTSGVWSSTRWDRNLAGLQPSKYRVAVLTTGWRS